jgi:hypothetical protein
MPDHATATSKTENPRPKKNYENNLLGVRYQM